MKKILTVIILSAITVFSVSAQTLKFGHINLQETVQLMAEMDSAKVVLTKYNNELQKTFTDMQNEFYTKYNTYQKMQATWSPAVLETKGKELQEMQTRIETYKQNASTEFQTKQQTLLNPIFLQAKEAVQKIGKQHGFTYIFDTSVANIPFINESVSVDVSDMVKKELNISLDKKLTTQNVQQGALN
ncbi:MAG: OmpH family outer membrane protein [Bacteroidales bacterium]